MTNPNHLDQLYCDEVHQMLNNGSRTNFKLADLGKIINKVDYGIASNRSLTKIIAADKRLAITSSNLVVLAANNRDSLMEVNNPDGEAMYCNDVFKLFTDSSYVHEKLTYIRREQLKLSVTSYESLYNATLDEISYTVINEILKRQDYDLSITVKQILSTDRRFNALNQTVKLAAAESMSIAVSANHMQYCNDVYNELQARNNDDGWHNTKLLSAFNVRRRRLGLDHLTPVTLLQYDRRFVFENDRFRLVANSNDNTSNENISNNVNNSNNINNSNDIINHHQNEVKRGLAEVKRFLSNIKGDVNKDGFTIEKNISIVSQPKLFTYKTIKIVDTSPQRRIPDYVINVNFITKLGYETSVENFSISQQSRSSVTLQYSPSRCGKHKCIMIFHFASGLKLARKISGSCTHDRQLYDVLNEGAPFKVKKRITQSVRIFQPMEGERQPQLSPKFPIELKKYAIPAILRISIDEAKESKLQQLKESLEIKDYCEYMDTLLYIEEMQWELDIRHFDMKDVPIQHEGSFIKLRVPGLAEKRPSVLRSDSVIFIYNDKEYRGYVWLVELDFVFLKFARALHDSILNNANVDVVFEFKRTGLRLIHQGLKGIKAVVNAKDIIHPSHPLNEELPQSSSIGFVNKNLNEQQKQAVISICHGAYMPAPFLIFGPPGTGKTESMCEAIKQIFRTGNSKILVMAPSNDAADNLLRRLTNIPKSEMFRLMAYNRERSCVDSKVMEYCLYRDGFEVPTFDKLIQYRVIVSTLSMASKLYNIGFNDTHFDAFFVDEAGYCFEAEIISVLGVLYNKENNNVKKQRIVLAGDPKQLGPVVHSSLALKFGLAESMIERMISNDSYPYKRDIEKYPNHNGYNPNMIVKLLNCYRCHPAILQVSNELFYDNELVSTADPIRRDAMIRWDGLLSPSFPLIFHGCDGENVREGNSPSWFNVSEIEICLQYIQQLKSSLFLGFTLRDIAIITPYNKQASKLRQALKLIGCGDVAVGSVETFQGQERKIIIISTVRSSPAFLDVDVKYNLGFVKNPKRFNVAITRAIALLIVIGSPAVLNTDQCWSKLLWHCVDNNSYTGVDLPKRPVDNVDNSKDEISDNLIQAIESFSTTMTQNNDLNENNDSVEGDNTWTDVQDQVNDQREVDSWELVENDPIRFEGVLGEWSRNE